MLMAWLLSFLLFLLLLAPPFSHAQSQTLYWQYTITNGTSVFGQWSVCASGSLTASTSSSSSNALKRPALTVSAITGQRVFSTPQGSTVQVIVGLLGNDNANLAADDVLYIDYPHVDTNGLAYLLDSPVIYGNGVFQYANVTIWPQAKTESYAPEGLGTGLTIATSAFSCPLIGNLVWAFTYTQQGTANGQAFTVCTTGLLTTTQANNNGQYTVVGASGSRQVTIGSDVTYAGNTRAQTITGVSAADGASNTLTTSAPYLTSGGLTLTLDTAAIYPSGAASQSYVTVQLINSAVVEKAGAPATSSSPFSLLNSQTLPLCPATQRWAFCYYEQSASSVDQVAAKTAQPWSVWVNGTFDTALAVQRGGNHPNGGAYTPFANFYVVTAIAGTRWQYTGQPNNPNNPFVLNQILGLADISAAYSYLANNRVYTTFPWLDEYGLLYELDHAIQHPGSSVTSNLVNLYGPKPVEGSEGTASWAWFSYAKYVPGQPSCPYESIPNTTVTLTYTTTTPNSLLSWSSCVSVQLQVIGPYPTVVAGRNAYAVLNATGTRTYTLNGVSTVQRIIGVTEVIGDHTVYDQVPYSIYQGGFALLLDGNVTHPGVTSKYNVLYVGDPWNFGYTIETNYERSFNATQITALTLTPGAQPNSCPTNTGGSTAATLAFSWSYQINSPAVNSAFGQWSVCASGTVTVSNGLVYPTAGKGQPGWPVMGFTGTRVFTDQRGSTVQQVQSLLGNGNANLAADDVLYAWYPFIDRSGIAFYSDTPVMYANGVYQYNNVTIWPLSYRNTVESYSPAPQLSTGFQVSTSSTPVVCALASQRVWTWSYTLQGTANGQPFTICAAGLVTTSSVAGSINGQTAYQVLSINGTRQLTIGSDLSPTGRHTLQNVVGVAPSSTDGADNYLLASVPILTSAGLTLQLDGGAVYPSSTASASYVTVQLSNGQATEKGNTGVTVSYNSGFSLVSGQSIPLCLARQAFSFCYASQGSYSTGQPWVVTVSGTFQTPLATANAGNHEDGVYLGIAPFYTLTSITGSRLQTNLQGTTTQQITGLASVSQSYNYLADNRIWQAWPYLSEYGWLYTLDQAVQFPGDGDSASSPSNLVNLCQATPVEDNSPNWAYLNYQPYIPGTAVPTCAAWPNSTISIAYTAVGSSSTINPWSSQVTAELVVQGPYNTVIAGRQGYTILAASGTRVFTLNGVSTTQRIVGTSSIDLFDNNIYTQAPYAMQFGGFSLLLDGPALFPAGASASSLIAVYNANGIAVYETNAENTASPNTISSIQFNGSGGSSGLSGGAIAGIVIGSVVGVAILIGLIGFLSGSSKNRKSLATERRMPTDSEASTNDVEMQEQP